MEDVILFNVFFAKWQEVIDNALVQNVRGIEPRSMHIQLYRTGGGYHYGKCLTAFVTFANEENAVDSLRLDGQLVNELTIWRPLVVEPAEPRLSYLKVYIYICVYVYIYIHIYIHIYIYLLT